ncbi:hypothetical protein ROA7450_03235 [Roseovarius albus]|uniref:Uncharacterized protein n=1 Tax=Roseovarius albus TaxID=1247867 RepID=A0A1X6ZVE4_9RHOB|nr:hypothetical protein ROA7450_03235 [Roseovarius albus]
MGRTEEVFSSHRSLIEELRQADATFEEICHDYDHLSHLVSAIPTDARYMSILSSVAALEEEIRGYLEKHKRSEQDPK